MQQLNLQIQKGKLTEDRKIAATVGVVAENMS